MPDISLRSKIIRLAHAKPELRPHLLPLVKTASAYWSGNTSTLGSLPAGSRDIAAAFADMWSAMAEKTFAPKVLAEMGMTKKDDWFDLTLAIRNLNWRDDQWVSPLAATAFAKMFVPSYNDFSYKAIISIARLVGEDVQIQFARKGSLALSVRAKSEETLLPLVATGRVALKADVCKLMPDGTVYLWWD
jgi:hypothetical protein